jgi:hypothetical protein
MNITNLSFFKARINDIEFNNEQDFNSVSFLLESIEERFNISITDPEFTKDVKNFVELASIKVDDFSYGELENATATSIMNANTLSDIQFLANYYDDGNYKWNSYINDKVKEDRGYPYIIDAIVREQFNAIESNNSIDTLLTTPLNNDLSIQDKEELYDNVNEYFSNNFLDDDYDDDFEFLYPKDNIYDTDVNQIVPSVFEKKTTIGLGTWESCEELYNGGPEALHKAFISRGESLYNDDALESNPELSKRYIPLERESLSYRKFINELDTYLGTNDKSYYVDLNTGLINDSHLSFMNNDIISDSSLDGYPGNKALYNYLPVAIAKGMATNQIAADGDILTQLPDIIGETQYNEFKKELAHIQAEYPNQIDYTINDNGIVSGITPYYGIYNTIYNPGTTVITDLDLKYKDKINMYHVLKGREERPIAAIITNGVSSQDFEGEHLLPENLRNDDSKIIVMTKKYENLLTDEEKNVFERKYRSVVDTLTNPNGGLNFSKFDKETQSMMESYVRLDKAGHLPQSFTIRDMENVIQYNMEVKLEGLLNQRSEQELSKNNQLTVSKETPKISFSKPKENGGLER